MMEIYTDIPIPKMRGIYPWDQLGVGHSIKFDNCTKFKTIRSSAFNAGKKRGWKFTTKIVDGTLWIWRVK